MYKRTRIRWLGILCCLLLLGQVGCAPPDPAATQAFLDSISQGPESELGGLLYGYDQASPGSQKVLLGMLKPLRAPSPGQHLAMEAWRDAGRFRMLVVHVPWSQPANGSDLRPIIVCRDSGHEQVVGYVLPFDDIFDRFKDFDRVNMTDLSKWWIETYAKKR